MWNTRRSNGRKQGFSHAARAENLSRDGGHFEWGLLFLKVGYPLGLHDELQTVVKWAKIEHLSAKVHRFGAVRVRLA